MSVMDTQPFDELTPAERQKQWISFAITVGNQRIEAKMVRIKKLALVHGALLPTEAQIENDLLWEQIALIVVNNEILKQVALDIR